MSEPVEETKDIVVEETVPLPDPKHYLLMIDELHMSILGKIIPDLKFVEVQGMPIEGSNEHMFLVNPMKKADETKLA